jgi:hypothetical protein
MLTQYLHAQAQGRTSVLNLSTSVRVESVTGALGDSEYMPTADASWQPDTAGTLVGECSLNMALVRSSASISTSTFLRAEARRVGQVGAGRPGRLPG